MRIERLYLRNFRNYDECLLEFAPGINLIYGQNAQGKTNILEALYLLMSGRSFRTTHMQELIQFGKKSFYVEILFEKKGAKHQLQMHYDGKEKKLLLDKEPLKTLSSLLGMIHGVLITPEDDALIKGSPRVRRNFLDLHIAKINPLYLDHLVRYTKAMRQRNALLKEHNAKMLFAFEQIMIDSATYISEIRKLALMELESRIDHEPEKISLTYKPSIFSTKNREREMIFGSTLSGPHREDFNTMIEQREARSFGSEGQKRSVVSALKLAQFKVIEKSTQETPLLCIDDVGISFDKTREAKLLEKVSTFEQVFLTSCQPEQLQGHLLHVDDGRVEMPHLLTP